MTHHDGREQVRRQRRRVAQPEGAADAALHPGASGLEGGGRVRVRRLARRRILLRPRRQVVLHIARFGV